MEENSTRTEQTIIMEGVKYYYKFLYYNSSISSLRRWPLTDELDSVRSPFS